jgi:hypothetical protein
MGRSDGAQLRPRRDPTARRSAGPAHGAGVRLTYRPHAAQWAPLIVANALLSSANSRDSGIARIVDGSLLAQFLDLPFFIGLQSSGIP